MREVKLRIILFAIIYFIYEAYSKSMEGLEAVPERAEVIYTNDKYVGNRSINVRKYSRRGGYVVNLWGVIKHNWDNNVTLDINFQEYLHNEYKRSFVDLHFKLCDLINKDEYIGAVLRQRGMTCPLEKGPNGFSNVTFWFPKFPNMFPLKKCRAELIFRTEPSHDLMAKAFIYFVMKQVGSN